MKDNPTKLEQKAQQWRPRTLVVDPGLKMWHKFPGKIAIFRLFGVARMFVEGAEHEQPVAKGKEGLGLVTQR